MAQDLGQQTEAHAERVFLGLGQALDVVVVHDHAERLGQPRHLLADRAEANDAQNLGPDLVDRRRRVAVPTAGRDIAVLGDQATRHRQHQQQCMLRDGDRVGAAVVAERDLALARRVEIGAIVARAQHLDQLQLRRVLEELRRDILLDETHEVVGAREGCLHLRRVVQRLHDLEALGRDVVDHRQAVLRAYHQNTLNHHNPSAAIRCPFSNPGSRPGSVRPQPHSALRPKSSTTCRAAAMRALSPASSSWCSRPR